MPLYSPWTVTLDSSALSWLLTYLLCLLSFIAIIPIVDYCFISCINAVIAIVLIMTPIHECVAGCSSLIWVGSSIVYEAAA